MIKKCVRCGKEFDRHPHAKYCWDCVDEVHDENQRRWYQKHREQIRERARQRRLHQKLEREAAK